VKSGGTYEKEEKDQRTHAIIGAAMEVFDNREKGYLKKSGFVSLKKLKSVKRKIGMNKKGKKKNFTDNNPDFADKNPCYP
jgi:hypothetical protein